MAEIQTQASAAQLQEVQLAAGLKQIEFREDGVFVVDTPASIYQRIMESDKPRGGDGGSLIESRPKTAAQERLIARRAAAARPNVQALNDGTDIWFVRTLSLPLLHELSLRTPRNEDGVLSLDDSAQYSQFLAAILFVCLVKGKDDLAPYFEQTEQGWKDALEQANDAEMTESNSLLINLSLILTPDILPSAAEKLGEMMDERVAAYGADANPLEAAPELPKSRGTRRINGSKPTPRTKRAST